MTMVSREETPAEVATRLGYWEGRYFILFDKVEAVLPQSNPNFSPECESLWGNSRRK